MREGAVRERGGSEVAFSLLRALARGYCLWGSESKLNLAELAYMIGATNADLARAIATLWDLDLVTLDHHRHTIQLSDQGILQLAKVRETLS